MRRMISQRRGVLAIVVGLLLTVVVALGVVVLVALPNLRQGSPILTPDGERAVRRAKQTAKQKPMAAVGGTWHGLVALQRLIARLSRRAGRIWAPISAALHEAMDRLEDRDRAKRNGSPAPMRHAAGTSRSPSAPSDAATESVESAESATPAGPAAATSDESDGTDGSDASGADPSDRPRQTRFDVARVIGNSSVGRPRESPAISGPIPEISATDWDERLINLHESEGSDADQGSGSARRPR
jgi:hypothetical protein